MGEEAAPRLRRGQFRFPPGRQFEFAADATLEPAAHEPHLFVSQIHGALTVAISASRERKREIVLRHVGLEVSQDVVKIRKRRLGIGAGA